MRKQGGLFYARIELSAQGQVVEPPTPKRSPHRTRLAILVDYSAMKLPNGDRAVVDLEKLTDYCLNPDHPRGKH